MYEHRMGRSRCAGRCRPPAKGSAWPWPPRSCQACRLPSRDEITATPAQTPYISSPTSGKHPLLLPPSLCQLSLSPSSSWPVGLACCPVLALMKFPLSTSLVFYLSLLLDELPRTQAVRFPIQGRIGGFSTSDATNSRGLNRLGARASIEGTPDITNSGNTMYKTNITLNGKQFNVLIDTGRCVRARHLAFIVAPRDTDVRARRISVPT